VAQTAPLVLAPHDSALFAMKRDAIPAPTPRHGCPRAATSSCETFISLITASGRPAGHRRAWARRVGARQPDLRYYRCCPRSASTSSGLSNEPNNSTFCPEIGSGQPFSVAAGLCLRGIASALRWALRARRAAAALTGGATHFPWAGEECDGGGFRRLSPRLLILSSRAAFVAWGAH
jgi:hypothetical protein